MNTKLDLLVQKLVAIGHGEIAVALRKGRVGMLNDRQKMVLTDASNCIRMEKVGLDEQRVKNALVEVTSSGWGREPESTEPGWIQPLMNL